MTSAPARGSWIGEALEMVFGVAELLRDHRQPAKCVANFQLVAHTHASMQLDRFLTDVTACIGNLDLGGRHYPLPLCGIVDGVNTGAS